MSFDIKMQLDKKTLGNIQRLTDKEFHPALKKAVSKLVKQVAKSAKKYIRKDTGELRKHTTIRVTGTAKTGHVYGIVGARNTRKDGVMKYGRNPVHYQHLENYGFLDKNKKFHPGSHAFDKAVAETGSDMGLKILIDGIKEGVEGVIKA